MIKLFIDLALGRGLESGLQWVRIFRVIPKKVVPRVPSGYGAVGLAIAKYLQVVRDSMLPWGMRGSCLNYTLAAPGCIPNFLFHRSSWLSS